MTRKFYFISSFLLFELFKAGREKKEAEKEVKNRYVNILLLNIFYIAFHEYYVDTLTHYAKTLSKSSYEVPSFFPFPSYLRKASQKGNFPLP